jgi:hypothetical protein
MADIGSLFVIHVDTGINLTALISNADKVPFFSDCPLIHTTIYIGKFGL